MGTYRQPASLVDTQSGKLSRQAMKEGFDAIGVIAEASIAQAAERKKKAKEMETARKQIWDAAAVAQGKGNALLEKYSIDDASLGTGINNVIKSQANAQIENLGLSTSDPKYQENLKIIANASQFTEGLPSMLEGGVYAESMLQDAINKGVGNKPGQIALGSMTAAELEANSQTSRVNLGWDTSFETVQDENGSWGLYTVAKNGDDIVRNAINYIPEDKDGSTQYNFGTYRIVPDASKETKDILIGDKTLNANGTLSDQYLVKTQEIVGNEVYDVTKVNTDQLFNQTSTVANVIGEKIIRNGSASAVDYIYSKGVKDPSNPDSKARGFISPKVNQDGSFVKKNGKVIFDDWVQVTDDNGELVQNTEVYKEDTGYLSDEQYDKFMQLVQVTTAADNGVFTPDKRILDGAATESLRKSIMDNQDDKSGLSGGKMTEAAKTRAYNKQQISNFYGGLTKKLSDININDTDALNNLQNQLDKEISKLFGANGGVYSFKIQKQPLTQKADIVIYKNTDTKNIVEGRFKLGDEKTDMNFAEMLDRIFIKELDEPENRGVPYINPGGVPNPLEQNTKTSVSQETAEFNTK